MKITEFEIVDHGIQSEQCFEGCGVSLTRYKHVVTGIGSNFAEAYDDACGMMAQSESEDIDWEDLDRRVLIDLGRCKFPVRPAVAEGEDDCHYCVSIRYNVSRV